MPFLGQRVYVAAIVVAAHTRASAGTAAAMRRLDTLGVPPSTVAQWRQRWQTEFLASPFWMLGRAAFVPPVNTAQCPASLLERFAVVSPPPTIVSRQLRTAGIAWLQHTVDRLNDAGYFFTGARRRAFWRDPQPYGNCKFAVFREE